MSVLLIVISSQGYFPIRVLLGHHNQRRQACKWQMHGATSYSSSNVSRSTKYTEYVTIKVMGIFYRMVMFRFRGQYLCTVFYDTHNHNQTTSFEVSQILFEEQMLFLHATHEIFVSFDNIKHCIFAISPYMYMASWIRTNSFRPSCSASTVLQVAGFCTLEFCVHFGSTTGYNKLYIFYHSAPSSSAYFPIQMCL